MSGYNALVWMTVATGGKWTRQEVYKALPSIGPKHINVALTTLARSGSITAYPGDTFGLTHDCTVPRGLSVGEVLKATGAAP
jgi:hypothetical protein